MLTTYVSFFLIASLGGGACEGKSLTLQPSEQKVVRQAGKGNSYFIRCRGKGNLIWKLLQGKEKVKSINTSTLERVHSEVSRLGLDLVFREIRSEDEGQYICENLDEGGQKVSFEMLVIQPIDFGETPLYQPVMLGQTKHKLSCNVRGHPFPSVTWKAKGKSIRSKAAQILSQDFRSDDKYEMDGTDLIIRDLSKEDEGKYQCKAVQIVQEGGVVKESSFKEILIDFKIEYKPSWIATVEHDQFYGYVAGRGNMSCTAMAEPPANFTWLDYTNNTVNNAVVETKDHKSTLTIPVEHHNIFGSYKCIAQNIHGTISKVVKLNEGAKPGTPWIEINKIFAGGMMLKIKEPKAEMFLKVEGFQIEFKEFNNSWMQSHTYELKLRRSSIYHLQGLKPKTLYNIRARSRNKAGLSDPSNVIFIKTNVQAAQVAHKCSSCTNGSKILEGTLNIGLLIVTIIAIMQSKQIKQWL